VIATVVTGVFFFVVLLALSGYEACVYRRDHKMMVVAATTEGIVDSLFPLNIRRLVFDPSETRTTTEQNCTDRQLKQDQMSKPLASYFPEATVLFADIAGFTAWSAARPPEHVFSLLETIFGSFDRIARRFGVYKIETIGDCYVAVTGLPDPQPLHAALMSQFAVESMRQMRILVGSLEEKLGKGTTDLSMRFGLHSGPVTAGVLRGERSRFQLFGETVNHASLIEKLCIPGRIHVSSATAGCLLAAGKGSWLTPRSDPIKIEGRGNLTTYWVSNTDDEATQVIEFHRYHAGVMN
jgi:class 3 adenylate cyclase